MLVPIYDSVYTSTQIVLTYITHTMRVCTLSFSTTYSVPTASPRNFVTANISSRSAVLMWDPPPPEHQNGNITQYIINATVLQSNERLQFFSESTSLVVDTLTPYTTYILFVAASTSVGTGPFTTSIVTIQTPQDGEHSSLWYGLVADCPNCQLFYFYKCLQARSQDF